MGDQVLDLARAYGGMDLTETKAPDRVFLSVRGLVLVHYPRSLGRCSPRAGARRRRLGPRKGG